MDNKILTAEQELKLRKPIDDRVGAIQKEIDDLRADGTNKVLFIQNEIDSVKRDRIYTKAEKDAKIAKYQAELEQARAVEAGNKDKIAKLISQAEEFLNANYDKDYFQPVKESCEREKALAKEKYAREVQRLEKEHKEALAKLSDHSEIKDEKYVHKNRLFAAKMELEKDLQQVKDKKHGAFAHKYHLLDMLRMSKFTFMEARAQKWENYKYTFNRRSFFLQNGLYIVIVLIFVALCIITPIVKNTPLLTYNNVLNILQQASPRMFLALGVAGLILLTGTDLSIGRMVGMGMTTATIIMHQGINTGGVFGHIFDFTGLPIPVRVIFALVVCIFLCTCFTSLAGFFTAKFKMHPFISTMANMLMIFGIITYATKVTMGAFMLAGVLYGFGSWLECARMVGSGSAAYGQGWDMDAIAACVVGGVSFTGGIGKISGVVVGVLIFTALTYSLTILGIDTNLQFVFEGIIIISAVTLDCLKYVQKK